MHKLSADIKIIRPFNRLYSTKPDESYLTWKKRNWSHLAIEIGCGAGLHPILWAQQNKNKGIIAIERTQTKFTSFKQRLKNHELPNIKAINQDALHWLPVNVSANQVDEYFFLYPNPYPKEKQAHKRWHRNPLFE